MYIVMAAEIIAAMFAVFGLYCAIKILAQRRFGSDRIIWAVEFKNKKDAEDAEMLIRESMGVFLSTKSCRVAALVDRELEGDEELMSILHRYGVDICIVDRKGDSVCDGS